MKLAATQDFPDHHPFTDGELAALVAKAVVLKAQLLTTEKDAMRLPPALRQQVAVLPITLAFENEVGLMALLPL